MLKLPPICYVYCFDQRNEKSSYERLKVSISSVPSHLFIYIITWHNDLENKLGKDFPYRNIYVIKKEFMKFSKSFFINQISNYAFEKDYKYIYLSDIDLFFHPEYFFWLEYFMKKLNYKKNDLRIITNNYNIRARSKIKFLPRKLYGKLSFYFPDLFDWKIPKSLDEILLREFSKSDYAHGCGLIPINSLLKIGGYNSEMYGHGPEDDLFNQRIKFFSRLYYHKGNYRSSTFHLPHPALNQQDRIKNHKYWFDIVDEINYNGIYSEQIEKK